MSTLISRSRAAAEDGFTMIIAIGVMFVTGLLLVAAFTVANGDVHNSKRDATEKMAYYAALAGIQQYEYQLQANPNFWQTCKKLESNVPAESQESYVVTAVPATGQAACSESNPFTSMIESKGLYANTFRVRATGYGGTKGKAGSATRSVIATFAVNGFLDYVYFTNYEQADPATYVNNGSGATCKRGRSCTFAELAKECEKKYYEQWSEEEIGCIAINFREGDQIEGPFHTNDAASIVGSATFGRKGHVPTDVVEMNGGSYGSASGCPSKGAIYYTTSGCSTVGSTLEAPPDDTSLEFYVTPEYHFYGVTRIKLEGKTMTITNNGVEKKAVAWPSNGLIYVQGSGTCGYEYEPQESDNSNETSTETGCGNVYVQGSYEKSLTVAGSNDVIVTESIYPTSVAGKLAKPKEAATKPSGTAVMGLIASNYVRMYHPCSGGTNQKGTVENPWIYAAILSTSHSWLNDNYACGSTTGELNVFGAIGQDYRGTVGQESNGKPVHGYIKNYEYDDRLATDEPPYFLAPLKAGWKIVRETAPSPG
jgi:type II secretory pathway pseudopilin PulG